MRSTDLTSPLPRHGNRRPGNTHPRVISVVGARPEIIQAAPLSAVLSRVVREIIVHTGQHYDESLSERQILSTGLPRPDHNLGVGSLPRDQQLALGQERLERLLEIERPDAVIVRGDTNATLSAARAARVADIPLVHVEAGLRSHRLDMPEEHNRIGTDRLSQLLLAPTQGARHNLEGERVKGEIHVTGDPMCDILESWRERIRPAEGDYLLATVHRNYNTDVRERLEAIFACLERSPWPVLMPLHPRTAARIRGWGLQAPLNVRMLEPIPYTRMLELERGAKAIATDSGGVQREAYMWGVRCLTLREETEWDDTLKTGWNTLVGIDPDAFQAALDRALPLQRPAIFGDGHASERIAAIVLELICEGQTHGVREQQPVVPSGARAQEAA